jgi:hypothetical protein
MSMPFAGHFSVANAPSQTWTARRLAAEITGHEKTVNDYAAAVTESDAARAATTADFLAGRTSFDCVLAAIDVQANQTAAFVDRLADYNQGIARYVTASSAQNEVVDNLATKLMIGP